MIPAAEPQNVHANNDLIRRSNILQAINRLSNGHLPGLSRNELLLKCSEILVKFSCFSGGWVGRYLAEEKEITPLSFIQNEPEQDENKKVCRKLILLDSLLIASVEQALDSGEPIVFRNVDPAINLPLTQDGTREAHREAKRCLRSDRERERR